MAFYIYIPSQLLNCDIEIGEFNEARFGQKKFTSTTYELEKKASTNFAYSLFNFKKKKKKNKTELAQFDLELTHVHKN